MIHRGEERTNGNRCRSNPSIGIDFQGAKVCSDTGILWLRKIDERFWITSALEEMLQESRNVSHTQHSCTDLLRQRVYQIAAGYEDCNDANELRKDPALRLALGKNNAYAARQSVRPPSPGGRGLSFGGWILRLRLQLSAEWQGGKHTAKGESFQTRESNRKKEWCYVDWYWVDAVCIGFGLMLCRLVFDWFMSLIKNKGSSFFTVCRSTL